MKRGLGARLMGLLMAALLCVSLFAAPALADEYDPLYPEKLSEGHLNATAAILIEADTGDVIFEKNADALMYPASTTKILTSWLALSLADGNLEQQITVSERAVNIASDESSAKLAAGEQMRLIDLLYAAMLLSGNDAANAIAEGMGGSVENFVNLMNQAAAALGCTATHFANPSGIHDDNHYTTARDMAKLARVAMQNATFRQIVGSASYTLPKDNVYRSRTISTKNDFLVKGDNSARYYEYGTGIKTGTTSAAGNCYVGSANKDGVSLISVVFGASSDAARYTDTIKLMNYGFSQYLSTSIAEIYMQNPRVIDILGFDLDDPEVGRLKLNLRKVDAAATDLVVTTQTQVDYWIKNFSSVTVTEFTREFRAPITEGEVMGTLTYTPPDGGTPVVYELLASRSIAARERLVPTIDEIIAEAENDPNPFPRPTFELVFFYLVLPAAAVLLIIRAVKFLRSKHHHRRRLRTFKPSGRYYR